ncbi:helix-turn-helix domain-containing protein [Hwangdonia seohaensis]|uniref:Helix-turn-helix domain-containing protein n=1 Tax=Hwangdonia seohaensis TaxID=1240727 RepID=A0ABW3RFE2_9FLAO|nr:helix-turn-helix domain-containing protein [Hwangdonia seohaensis]
MADVTQTHNTTPEELIEKFLKGVDERFEDLKKNFTPREPDELLTTKELEKELKISAVTRWNWEKKKILTPRKIGARTYYLRSEIKELLLNSNK